MTVSFFLICTILIAAAAILITAQHRRRELKLTRGLVLVDTRAMARLLSVEDDQFLAANVSLLVLLQLRICRAVAAGEYLGRLRANSRYAAGVARSYPQHSAVLLRAAGALRLEIAKLQWKIWLGVLSSINVDLARVDALTRQFSDLTEPSAVPIR